MTGLSGTGRLADDLYLLAHHEVTGRPHLQPRATGLGLAGALLAELMLAGSIGLRSGHVVIARNRPPGDGLAQSVLSLIAGERERHPAGDWLLFLARTAPHDVAQRLEQSGYLTTVTARRPFRSRHVGPSRPQLRVRAAAAGQVGVRPIQASDHPEPHPGRAGRRMRAGPPPHAVPARRRPPPHPQGDPPAAPRPARPDRPHPGRRRQRPAVPPQMKPLSQPTHPPTSQEKT